MIKSSAVEEATEEVAEAEPEAQPFTVSVEAVFSVFTMAKISMNRGFRPTRKIADGYREIRAELKRMGRIPS